MNIVPLVIACLGFASVLVLLLQKAQPLSKRQRVDLGFAFALSLYMLGLAGDDSASQVWRVARWMGFAAMGGTFAARYWLRHREKTLQQ
jgi:hypothetical protein